jgi:glucose-1-phosphatase
MTIRGIVFDIGGVLEITPDLGVTTMWEQRLQLAPGRLDERLRSVWIAGSLGSILGSEVHQSIREIMGMSEAQVNAFMEDIWKEYLGTLNTDLVEYFRSLRPKYQTAILSNSFIGAREREQEIYHFDEICDFIIYSHEVGIAKPDLRIYDLTCERLGLSPKEVILLDDYQESIEAAHEFGIHGILFQNNAQAIADIQACIQTNAS